jgi:hypothetical protein
MAKNQLRDQMKWLCTILKLHDYEITVRNPRPSPDSGHTTIVLTRNRKVYRFSDPDLLVINKQLLMLINNLAETKA